MAVISNTTTIIDAGAISVASGAMTLIKTLTASSSGTLSFVDGASSVVLDGTYKKYIFKFINIHPQTDDTGLTVGFRDGSTAYDATKTTSFFRATHGEDGTSGAVAYVTGADIEQGTGFQQITQRLGSDNDQVGSGHLRIYDPSNTTFVKHFISRFSIYEAGDFAEDDFFSGFFDTTTALTRFRFKMTSGAIGSGTIKLYGIS